MLHTPLDMDERSQHARTTDTQRWDELFEATVQERGQRMASYIRRLDTGETHQPNDPDGFQVSVAIWMQTLLKPLRRSGLTLDEAAEHFQRMHGVRIVDEVTDQILTDDPGHQNSSNTPG